MLVKLVCRSNLDLKSANHDDIIFIASNGDVWFDL